MVRLRVSTIPYETSFAWLISSLRNLFTTRPCKARFILLDIKGEVLVSEIFQRVGDPYALVVPDWYDPAELLKRFSSSGVPMTEEMKDLVKQVTSGKKKADEVFPAPSFELAPGMRLRVRALNVASQVTMTIAGCIEYLTNEDALLPGMYGLMLAYLEIPEFFETQPIASRNQKDFPFYSFKSPDVKANAYLDDKGKVRSPYIRYRHAKLEDTADITYKVEAFGHAVYKILGHTSLIMMFRHHH